MHAAEQQLSPAAARIEPALLPSRVRSCGSHCQAAELADTQTRTRNAKFFTNIPGGS
jgi:hypothetical protein